ncbi:hypothetical protein LEP1GSC058_1625 [Leptospira fainei serovar Hurstbridge str. BUT 6]|uniref:Uncharacterized protein n=1 Tax=Leptospira fainei serovar Hurstbridge str. BUT 6 TaxID=1193011 RepID=S3UX99_9LEPT|nr:hypothetical protein LEP1GSC058_1625 [Leptospira fainei serovar Hurstbridge str. BUT 6]
MSGKFENKGALNNKETDARTFAYFRENENVFNFNLALWDYLGKLIIKLTGPVFIFGLSICLKPMLLFPHGTY